MTVGMSGDHLAALRAFPSNDYTTVDRISSQLDQDGYVSWADGCVQIVVSCRGDDSGGFCIITSACWRAADAQSRWQRNRGAAGNPEVS